MHLPEEPILAAKILENTAFLGYCNGLYVVAAAIPIKPGQALLQAFLLIMAAQSSGLQQQKDNEEFIEKLVEMENGRKKVLKPGRQMMRLELAN